MVVAAVVAQLAFAGLLTFAGIIALPHETHACGPFTRGVSAIGSCDWIGYRER
jgi:hypothetical protein